MAVRPPVDIVAEKHQSRLRCGPGAGVSLDRIEQPGEQIVAAVDIADGIDALAVGQARHVGSNALKLLDPSQPCGVALLYSEISARMTPPCG